MTTNVTDLEVAGSPLWNFAERPDVLNLLGQLRDGLIHPLEYSIAIFDKAMACGLIYEQAWVIQLKD